MKLLKHLISEMADHAVNEFCHAHRLTAAQFKDPVAVMAQMGSRIERLDAADVYDLAATHAAARHAQTFIIDSEQVRALLRAVDKQQPPGLIRPPFNRMIFQFTHDIPEPEFLSGYMPLRDANREATRKLAYERMGETVLAQLHANGIDPLAAVDGVAGLVVGFPHDADDDVINVSAWYRSSAVNRARALLTSNGEIDAAASWGIDFDQRGYSDKQRIFNLALLIITYISTPGMRIEKHGATASVNRRRERKGRAPLPDYYTVTWAVNRDRTITRRGSSGTGSAHTFRYDVTGHFRRLDDGRLVWVRPHQRGLEHEQYKPKVYKVK